MIVKLMRRICGDIDSVTRAHHLFGTTKSNVEFAFKQGESLFKVVTMRRWSAARRDVHIDKAEAARRVLAGEKNRVRVSDHPDMRRLRVGVSLGYRKLPLKVIGRNR
jgi:transcriptional regulator